MPRALRETFMPQLAQEPFCSSVCCRTWHGAELADTTQQRAQTARAERQQDAEAT